MLRGTTRPSGVVLVVSRTLRIWFVYWNHNSIVAYISKFLSFNLVEQKWWQRMSRCLMHVWANLEELFVQKTFTGWCMSLTVTHPDLIRSEEESVTRVRTGLLHYWLRAICCLEGLAEKKGERGITERGLMSSQHPCLVLTQPLSKVSLSPSAKPISPVCGLKSWIWH